jgi:hypothetical protein
MMKWMSIMRMIKPLRTIIYESMRKSDIDIKMRVRDEIGTNWRRGNTICTGKSTMITRRYRTSMII